MTDALILGYISHLSYCYYPTYIFIVGGLRAASLVDPVAQSLRLMGLTDGRYIYCHDLHLLASAEITHPPGRLETSRYSSPSPVVLSRFAHCLAAYPDPRLTAFLIQGLSEGFQVGASGRLMARSTARNHPSCASCPAAVNSFTTAEQGAGRMVIPRQPALHDTHVSPIGLVPKGHSGTAWRMIVDLSHPRGRSLNDLISPDVCTLSYPSIDDAVDFVVSMGRYTQLVKIDLKSAYRILPIHPADRVLLGISWEGQVYLDGCLPFGL